MGINTHFREGATLMNCNIEFISLKPFVKFVKQLNGQDVALVKLRFQLDSSLYINKIQIHAKPVAIEGRLIDLDKIGVELKLTLLQVTISSMRTPVPVISMNEPI